MCKKNESGRRRKVGGKNDVGRRTKELASFHDTIRTWRRRKELVSRDGVTPQFTAVHRVFASTTSKIRGEGGERESRTTRRIAKDARQWAAFYGV